MLLIFISFLAGVLTVLAPCVLPLLPIIIGGSIGGESHNHLRPVIIATSLAASLIGFTLLLKVSTSLASIPPSALTDISGSIILALGLVSIFPGTWDKLIAKVNWASRSDAFLRFGSHTSNKFLGPILIGVALGPVFSSCSPTYAFILATILPHSFSTGLLYLTSYALGLVIALLIVSTAGRKILSRYSWAVDTHSLFRRSLGVMFVLVGLAVITGWDLRVESWIDARLPYNEAALEQSLFHPQAKNNASSLLITPGLPEPTFVGLTNWINSPPLQLSALKGKVVLVDFWTYSCINCLRTLPYVETWYKQYASSGLVIIGVSTPEFAFEHVPQNVQAAVKANKITYPVALDNNDETWNAFSNNSWPADYLIDKSGRVRYSSIGEGDYDKTEKAIQQLLGVNNPLSVHNAGVPITKEQTPETYFGTDRAMNYGGKPYLANGQNQYTQTTALIPNSWTLGGQWDVAPDGVTSLSDSSTLSFAVQAKDVYVVASSSTPAVMGVKLPGGTSSDFGPDAPGGQATISGSRLYHIVSNKAFSSEPVILTVPSSVKLYTFTFGS